jgi:hypothetical protein
VKIALPSTSVSKSLGYSGHYYFLAEEEQILEFPFENYTHTHITHTHTYNTHTHIKTYSHTHHTHGVFQAESAILRAKRDQVITSI